MNLQEVLSAHGEKYSFPVLLVVGCGRVGESITKTLVDNGPVGDVKIYVTDTDKERARKLSEYRLSSINPVKWRSAHDTPDDVDLILICVDHDSEEKIIDRLALSKKPFVSMSDDASVFDSYEDFSKDFVKQKIKGIIGAGLVPGISEVLLSYVCESFDEIFDITVDRMGFVSSSSLSSVKEARKENPLSFRGGKLTDSKRKNGEALSWFPNPYRYLETQGVATGVISLARTFPIAQNITVRFVEPKLPTFSERVRNIFLKTPLGTTYACVKVEVHGMLNGEIKTRTIALVGDALTLVTIQCILTLIGLHENVVKNESKTNPQIPFLSCSQVVETKKALTLLYQSGAKIYEFVGVEN